MLLAHQRKMLLFNYCADSEETNWDWRIHVPIFRANNIQVGIIGLGRIGTAVALRLKAFNYKKIGFYDPYLPRGVEKAIGLKRYHDLELLLSSSDIVTLHVPLTDETMGMVDESFFKLLKPRAILINTARGGIFKNVDVMYNFLKQRQELRIGSDVWPDEPPKDHPLIKAWRERQEWLGDRLILTPHSSFYSEESARELRAFAAEIVKSVLKDGKPYNIVNGAKR